MDDRINLVGGHSHGLQVRATDDEILRVRDLATGEVELYRALAYDADDGPRRAYVAMDLDDAVATSIDASLREAPGECW